MASDSEEANSDSITLKIFHALNKMEKRLDRLEGDTSQSKSKNRTYETDSSSTLNKEANGTIDSIQPCVVEHNDSHRVCDNSSNDTNASSSRGGSTQSHSRDGRDRQNSSCETAVPSVSGTSRDRTATSASVEVSVSKRARVAGNANKRPPAHELSDSDSNIDEQDNDHDEEESEEEDVYTQMRNDCITNNKDAESINKDLAYIVENKFDFPQPSESLIKTMGKFSIPENCQSVKPPTLDKELVDKGLLSKAAQQTDNRLCYVQNILAHTTVAVISSSEKIHDQVLTDIKKGQIDTKKISKQLKVLWK